MNTEHWQTVLEALRTARFVAKHEEIYGNPNKLARIDAAIAEVEAWREAGATQAAAMPQAEYERAPDVQIDNDDARAFVDGWAVVQTLYRRATGDQSKLLLMRRRAPG